MADDVINIRLQVDETTATQVQNRVQNIISKFNTQSVKLRFEAININQINSQVDALQKKIKQLQGASVNFNTNVALTTEQQQYRLETQRLAVLQRIELAKERTAQSEAQTIAALAQENRTLTHTLNLNEQINGQVQHTHEHIRNINTNTRDFIDYLSDGVRYLLVYRSLYKIMNQISESFSEMKNVDKELISVRKTTGMSENEIDAIRKASYGVATEYGRTASEYLGSVSEFARGGYKELSTELAKVSLLTQNVGDVNSETADRMLLSIDAAYGLKGSVSELTNVVNGLNEVANLNPTSVAKLSDGMQVSASVAKVAGLEISDLVSLIGTATSVTQRDGAEVSRAIRTILMNIRQVKGELDDGTVIDGDSIAKAEAALEGVGIATKEVVNGVRELRDPMDILDELAGKWHTLNSEAQSVILQNLANKRQSNVLAAILENWDMVGKMQSEYFNSANSAIEENELYLKGWEATSKKVTAKFTEYIANMANTSMIIDSLNALYGVLVALDTPIGRIAASIVLVNTALAVSGRLWQAIRARSIVADILSMGVAERNLSTAIQLVTGHLWEQLTAWLATPFGQLTAAVTAATVVVKAYDKALSTTHETAQKNISQSDEQIKKYDSEISSLEELRSKLAEAKDNKEALAFIQSDLNKEIGETPGLLNGESSAYETANKKIQSRIDLMKELKEEEQSRRIKNSKEAFNSNFVDVFGLNESGDSIRKQVKAYSRLKNDENSIIGIGFKDSLDYINRSRSPVHQIREEDWESYWNEQVELAQDIFADTVNDYNGIGGSNFLNLIIEDAVKSGDDLTQINEVIKGFNENKSLQDSVNKYWESLSNNTDSEKTLDAVSGELDKLKQKYPEVINLVDKLYETISKGKSKKTETAGENANETAIPSIEELTKSLDKIQSAYQAVESAIEEYNKEGYLSVDTFQSLMELEPQYLNMLLDENGNLNLNTTAIQENTAAYIENLGAKSALNLIDNVSKYSGEAAQLEYLTGATNDLTSATWGLVESRLNDAAKVSSPVVMAALRERTNAIHQMIESAKAGIGKGGLSKSASDTSDKIKDTKKQLDDLAKTEALDALKYKFDQLEQSIEKVDNAMSLLDTTLDLQAENDYVGKLETVTRQLDLAQQKSALLRDEFAQLSNTQYSTADEANELATRMKSVADSIADNSKNIIEYGKSITEYYMSAMSSIGSMADASIERATSLFERNVKTLQEGGLTGLQFNLSPTVPQSAFEKQRQENRDMEDEMRSYYDTVAEMQKTALDMQYQETVADNERKRQELLGSLNEAMSTQQAYSIGTQSLQKSTNDATSQEQVQDDKEKLAEQESFISSMEENITGLNNWMVENPIKAPELDNSWQQRVEEAKKYAQEIKDALSGSDNTSGTDETTNTGEGLVETAKKYLGTPYKWGGTSPTTGFDCSGLMYYVYKENGKSIPRTSQEQYKGGTAVDKSALSEEDLVFFSTDGSGTATHVGMYVGDNKFIHAPRTGDVVKYSDLNSKYYKEHYLGARRYAKGTKDFAVYGDNINGVAGEHYKPEILINKKTGDMIPIDEPTFVDTGKYDVVGEKTTAKALPQYANGTFGNMNMSSELPKLSVEQIQKVLSTNFKNSKLNVAGAAEGIFNAQQSTGISALAMLSIAAGESAWGTSKLANAKNNYWGWNHFFDNGKSAFERATTFSSNPGEAFKAYGEKLISAGYSEQSLAKMADRYCPDGKWYGLVSGTMSTIVNTLNDAGLGDMSANIATTASNTASITSNVSSIRHSFDSQLQEWLNGGDSTSTSSTTEDELLAYIKGNIKLSEYGNEEFIKKWDAFQEINEKGNIKFKALDEFLLKSVGTSNYNATKDSIVKEINDYTNAIMEASAEANLAELKRQYDINKDIANKMLAFYNYKKAEGATADVLTTIINSYNEQLEKVQDISDKWVSTMQSLTDYLMSQDATKLQAHDDRLSWIEKENEEFTRQYENTDENDFASKTALAGQILDRYNQIISENVKKQNTAHQNVLDLYNNEDYMPIFERYDVEAWFDASGEATAKYNEELAALSATDSELATVMAQVFAIIQQNRKAFYEADAAIQSTNESLIDFNKNRKLENVDVYIKYQERLVETLDFDASISQSLSTAKEGMYNIFKTLRDEKAEMDKELKSNMQIDDWLTKDTRDLLFNTEDYEKQMGVINGIETKARSLYATYQKDLANLREDELYKEEEITTEYNRQLEKLQDKLSIAKADLQLAKDKTAFENTRKERDTQIITGNRVQNVADPERLREAAMKMAESDSNLENEQKTSQENQDIRNMEIATGMINQEKAAIQNRIDMINDMTSAEREALAGYIEPIEIIGAKLNAISKTNPERIINEDNSNKVLSGLDLTKRDGWSLTGDYSEMVEMFNNLLENGYYKKNTFEYDMIKNLVEWIKWQHDNKTTSDAYNYGYSLYNADNAYLWGKGAMKIYSDDAFRVMSQPTVPVDEYINDIINSRIDEEKFNVVVSGGINVVTNNPQSTYPSFLQGYEELDDVYEIKNTLSIDENTASTILERLKVGNIAPTIDTFVTLAEMSKVWGNASDTRGNTDNSVHMENVNITLEKPVTNPNDFVQQFINKVYSEYSTTNNQR